MQNKTSKLVLCTLILTFLVIILGAYTRLKDAGLGCPDWPGCYGRLSPSAKTDANIEMQKAWIEMIHRYVASLLGMLIVAINVFVKKFRILTLSLLILVIFQGLLGMWTVTMRLDPLIVMGHLLGGLTILSLLTVLYLKLNYHRPATKKDISLKIFAWLLLLGLIIQIGLGGWTSANYAALVCADFPTCQGHWWPPLDWHNAFSHGKVLENSARVTIQMAHRLGALFVTLCIMLLTLKLICSKEQKMKLRAFVLLFLLATQIFLGITNILAGLPLFVSLLHSAVAALLLISTLNILVNLYAE